MATEQEQDPVLLRAIHIDLQQRSITLEAEGQSATRLTLTPQGIHYQLLGSSSITERAVEQLTAPAHDDVSQGREDLLPSDANMAPLKNPSVVLSGRLKTQPKEGKADSQGHPTAWARFAAHEEEGARLYSCTFHRGSARIALGLPVEAQIVVEGYAHPSTEPGKRLDTLSVFRLLNYPGKSEKV